MAVRPLKERIRLRALALAASAEGAGLAIGLSALSRLPTDGETAWWLGLTAATLWIAYVRRISVPGACAFGFFYGWLSLLGRLEWIYVGAASRLGGKIVAVAVAACALEAIPIALGAAAFAFAARRGSAVAFFVGAPAAYAFFETLRANGPLALPFATLGLAQTSGPLAGTIAAGGIAFAGFVCLALAASLGSFVVALAGRDRRLRRDSLVALAAAASVAALCGAALQGNLAASRSAVARIGIVQAGPIGIGESFGTTADRYERATVGLRGRHVAYVLWPEGVLFLTESDANRQREAALRAARDAGVPVLAGATVRTGGILRNVLLEIGPAGSFASVYAKRELVPFGEYQPIAFSHDAARAYSSGTGPSVVRIGTKAPFGVLICYEVGFAGLAHASAGAGARYLVAVLNDSWFAGSDGPAEQTQLARARALEEGSDVVRLDTVEPSGVLEPDGTWAASPLAGKAATAVVDVRGPVFAPYRALPTLAVPALLGALALLAVRRKSPAG